MFILMFFFVGLISSELLYSPLYFSGYRDSFKAIHYDLPNTNLILSSPHAGSDIPDDIPDRTIGGCQRNTSTVCTFHFNDSCSDGNRCSITTVQDFASFDQFTEDLVDELHRTYNLLPFAIVAQWNRKKIDFNREISEATFNHPKTIKAYNRYHNYLRKSVKQIQKKYNGTGLLLDIHQHGQGNYTMIGIRLSGVQLNNDILSPTSIESLIELSCPQNRSECIRGSKSLGTFFESNGLGISYPSLNNPKPNKNVFYKGGFITNHYSSNINVIQTELSYVVRNEFDSKIYVEKYAKAITGFMKANQLLQ
ncbi:unnamed protein product [Rotaria magnacalcarata]|uniref:N-formylglutamate amidohydrolase n=1 Tax=Rotaria magnacalcarata TaxID=392030 RepID=A0A818ZU50_9BILA|nr:unnamed protein product [Rotaria magnacalcarata]CAF3774810.1 unnamed protein product [Rotaria magnacalcarata]